MSITFIVRMHRERFITQNGFRARRGDDEVFFTLVLCAFERLAHVIKMASDLFVLHLNV